MPKSKETLLKVAETKTKMANKCYARAMNNPDKYGYEFKNAKMLYDTAKRARESAEKID